MNSLSASPDREIKPLAGNKGLILAIRVFFSRLGALILAFAFAVWVLSSSVQTISSSEPTIAAIEVSLDSLIGVESLLLAQENTIRERSLLEEPPHIIYPESWPFLVGLPASMVPDSKAEDWAEFLSREAAKSIYENGPSVVLSEGATSRESWFTVSGVFLRVWSVWNLSTHETASGFADASFIVSAVLFPLIVVAGVGRERFFTSGLIILIAGIPTIVVFGLAMICWYIVAPAGIGFPGTMRDLGHIALWQGFRNGLLISSTGLVWLSFLYLFRWYKGRFRTRLH
ncbi:MAG: hypothetical protein VYD09_02470 [Chloroflexota bacterium]|nr:hypothetical protein [Chloroflexota bacterium]